ncbi:MAG TPA: hypothetical protein DD618_01545 [Acholeplasmatales bacterium]|nr:hypothetical protein [Acholeplasmatales bacterium]
MESIIMGYFLIFISLYLEKNEIYYNIGDHGCKATCNGLRNLQKKKSLEIVPKCIHFNTKANF